MPDTFLSLARYAPLLSEADTTLEQFADWSGQPLADDALILAKAAFHAPYLTSLCRKYPQNLHMIAQKGAEACFEEVMHAVKTLNKTESIEVSKAALRHAKGKMHLLLAAGDFSGWPLEVVTQKFSDFADAAIIKALDIALYQAALMGYLKKDVSAEDSGLFILALGKLGAGELNYSSDIDLSVFFDREKFITVKKSSQEVAVWVTRLIVDLLNSMTIDGYVFRTDLRLRPDPRSTPLALSVQAAEYYYEHQGQNWERMVYIKARCCAGDRQAAQAFLKAMQPFIWRRHLDYWAVHDIYALKRQINSHIGAGALSDPAFDVKLGVGGIREIEFFAQTQQLILGGRNANLRVRDTLSALKILEATEVIEANVSTGLQTAYIAFRHIEHRIQMLADEHTHNLTASTPERQKVAHMMGYETLSEFDQALEESRRFVSRVYQGLFAQEERLNAAAGNLVFTGVDIDPDTEKTIAGFGFSEPARIIETIQDWHRGNIKALRTPRGRELFTALTPRLLELMGQTGDPDRAFDGFSDFLSSLSTGVQTLSLLLAEAVLCEHFIFALALSPRLCRDLANHPETLDVMLDSQFATPIMKNDLAERDALEGLIYRAEGLEAAMNAARQLHRERAFRIGFQLLNQQITVREAGWAYALLADSCIRALSKVVYEDIALKLDPLSGRWVVCGLGKLGGRELSATSDLDLMVVYESEDSEAQRFFTRFTQRMITALSASTEEGGLYEVDMQLRPSGRAGPVAVKKSAFDKYYKKDAWTWEVMALTRLRPIAGDQDFMQALEMSAHQVITRPRDVERLRIDILDMRCRLAREKPAKTIWDLKQTPGGLIDIEFILQWAILHYAHAYPDLVHSSSVQVIDNLSKTQILPQSEIEHLHKALSVHLNLQQVLRIALVGDMDCNRVTTGLERVLAKAGYAENFSQLETDLVKLQKETAALREKYIGEVP